MIIKLLKPRVFQVLIGKEGNFPVSAMDDRKLREINEIVSSPENASKNSISLLMEAASQVGETVTFNHVDELGLSNTKLFICEVKVGRLAKCRGSGNNKKMAKANAADQAIEDIRRRAGDPSTIPRRACEVIDTLRYSGSGYG